MPGQAVVIIGDKRWLVNLATSYQELVTGLGGLSSIPAATGMLFDMGAERQIAVTTVPMLFPLDIVFINHSLVVTELVTKVAPGRLLTSQVPARYFLEVNAGEADGVQAGNPVTIEVQPAAIEQNSVATLVSQIIDVVGVAMALSLMLGMVKANVESQA